MLELRTIDISDKDWICRALARSDLRGCEYSFANNMAWRRMYNTQIAEFDSFYISVSDNRRFYTFPSGGDRDTPLSTYKRLFDALRHNSEQNNIPFAVSSVTKDNIGIFEELYKGEYTVTTDEGSWDYVYDSSDLIALS
ncbi:MAG: hypothetical protein ILP19_02245, partial [Oscillospiraceae bacterium]|nr:hypothetical protein [Oscillospiraceae bacterium]